MDAASGDSVWPLPLYTSLKLACFQRILALVQRWCLSNGHSQASARIAMQVLVQQVYGSAGKSHNKDSS